MCARLRNFQGSSCDYRANVRLKIIVTQNTMLTIGKDVPWSFFVVEKLDSVDLDFYWISVLTSLWGSEARVRSWRNPGQHLSSLVWVAWLQLRQKVLLHLFRKQDVACSFFAENLQLHFRSGNSATPSLSLPLFYFLFLDGCQRFVWYLYPLIGSPFHVVLRHCRDSHAASFIKEDSYIYYESRTSLF